MEAKKITWNEVFARNYYVRALPLKGLEGKSLYLLVMLKASLAKATERFEAMMQEGLKKLKEEKYPDFDKESQKPEAERCAEYKGWLAALEADYAQMRMAEGAKEAEGAPAVTVEHLEAACQIGANGMAVIDMRTVQGEDGEQRAVPVEVPVEQLLLAIASMAE